MCLNSGFSIFATLADIYIMSVKDIIFRFVSTLSHRFCSVNTLGHGIHSPYLYYLVRFILYDDNSYYCYAPIERERARLMKATKLIDVVDYGTGSSGKRTLSTIARTSLMPVQDAQIVFRLAHFIRPYTVVELGTSLGVTTTYLSCAVPSDANIYSFEGSKALIAEADKVLSKVGNRARVQFVAGNIDDTLSDILASIEQVDLAIIDANHTQEAAVRYFDLIAAKCTGKSVVLMDDIRYSLPMYEAWKLICADSRVTSSFDLGDMGILFFDKQFLNKHYKLRI